MVKLDLQVRARLENLSEISLQPDDDWFFKTKCANCHEEHPNNIHFKLVDLLELPGSKGLATYIQKCKFCERTGNIEYQKDTWRPYTSEAEEWQTIATFDCRGVEFAEFYQGNQWCAQASKSDSQWGSRLGRDPIEFDGSDWAGYDEEADDSVGIYEFKA